MICPICNRCNRFASSKRTDLLTDRVKPRGSGQVRSGRVGLGKRVTRPDTIRPVRLRILPDPTRPAAGGAMTRERALKENNLKETACNEELDEYLKLNFVNNNGQFFVGCTLCIHPHPRGLHRPPRLACGNPPLQHRRFYTRYQARNKRRAALSPTNCKPRERNNDDGGVRRLGGEGRQGHRPPGTILCSVQPPPYCGPSEALSRYKMAKTARRDWVVALIAWNE